MATGHFVLVGCGAAKRDVDEAVEARDLYDSVYFSLKRRYAEAHAIRDRNGWCILSAEHGVIPNRLDIEPYDTTIEDLQEPAPDAIRESDAPAHKGIDTRLDWWADRVAIGLNSWLRWPFESESAPNESPCDRLTVLAGQRYVAPLRERGAFEGLPGTVRFPFEDQDLGGIGEQMHWLKNEIEAAPDRPQLAEQDAVAAPALPKTVLAETWPDDHEQAGLDAFDYEQHRPSSQATVEAFLRETAADGGDGDAS